MLIPQLLYAGERAPITYWVGRGWAPSQSAHWRKERETAYVGN